MDGFTFKSAWLIALIIKKLKLNKPSHSIWMNKILRVNKRCKWTIIVCGDVRYYLGPGSKSIVKVIPYSVTVIFILLLRSYLTVLQSFSF
jgi:hypothetical protein